MTLFLWPGFPLQTQRAHNRTLICLTLIHSGITELLIQVPHQDSLGSFTKDRVRPTQRRKPLRNSSQRSEDSKTSIWSDVMLSTGYDITPHCNSNYLVHLRSEDNQEDLQSPR